MPATTGKAVDDTDVYRRLYDEVLADPAVAGVTRDLLAGLPVPADVVVDNLRLVAPASAVRGAVNTLSSQISGYLGGQRPTLTLSVDLRPMFAAIAKLGGDREARHHLPGRADFGHADLPGP